MVFNNQFFKVTDENLVLYSRRSGSKEYNENEDNDKKLEDAEAKVRNYTCLFI